MNSLFFFVIQLFPRKDNWITISEVDFTEKQIANIDAIDNWHLNFNFSGSVIAELITYYLGT